MRKRNQTDNQQVEKGRKGINRAPWCEGKKFALFVGEKEGKKKKGRKVRVRVKIWGRREQVQTEATEGQCKKTGAKMEVVDTWAPAVCHLLASVRHCHCAWGNHGPNGRCKSQKLQGRNQRVADR